MWKYRPLVPAGLGTRFSVFGTPWRPEDLYETILKGYKEDTLRVETKNQAVQDEAAYGVVHVNNGDVLRIVVDAPTVQATPSGQPLFDVGKALTARDEDLASLSRKCRELREKNVDLERRNTLLLTLKTKFEKNRDEWRAYAMGHCNNTPSWGIYAESSAPAKTVIDKLREQVAALEAKVTAQVVPSVVERSLTAQLQNLKLSNTRLLNERNTLSADIKLVSERRDKWRTRCQALEKLLRPFQELQEVLRAKVVLPPAPTDDNICRANDDDVPF